MSLNSHLLNVMGHLREILMAVCSTPSCSLPVGLPPELVAPVEPPPPLFSGLFKLLLEIFNVLPPEPPPTVAVGKLVWLFPRPRGLLIWLLALLLLEDEAATELEKFLFILLIQRSAGRRRFLRRFCKTDRTLGRCTSCSTNKWDCKRKRNDIKFWTFFEEKKIELD